TERLLRLVGAVPRGELSCRSRIIEVSACSTCIAQLLRELAHARLGRPSLVLGASPGRGLLLDTLRERVRLVDRAAPRRLAVCDARRAAEAVFPSVRPA